MSPQQAVRQNQEREYERYEAYHDWERQQLSDPRFASVRFLYSDLRDHGEIRPDTWERFDVEELTGAAEMLNAPHTHVDRFVFDGQDVIVKESYGVNPQVSLRDVYQKGLDKTHEDFVTEPGLAFQLRRDELFMEFYEEIERMMKGRTDHDTIQMVSTCPTPEEMPFEHEEAVRLLNSRFYNLKQRKSFDYTARRLPDGRLELSATRLDSSNLDAHAKVLQAFGYENVSFGLMKSHGYGEFLSYDNTTERPIESVIAERVAVYDAELEAQTGQRHRFGRVDDTVDAHEFFREHCGEYWAGYKAYNELLARHLAGEELQRPLQKYLLKCLEGQEQVGQSVLSQEGLARLRTQLWHGKVTMDMAMSCRELLIYDHHATLTRLLKQYSETGQVDRLGYAEEGDFMGAYADAASSNGTAAAAAGETFAGCETATGVNSLSAAAQSAAESGMTLEQTLRGQEEEAAHCLRIQLYGFTIRRDVHCPFCDKQVDARDTAASIECLAEDCRTVLNKATGETTSLRSEEEAGPDKETQNVVQLSRPMKLRAGQVYRLGDAEYRRQQRTVVGGVQVTYIGESGDVVSGRDADEMDAIISQQPLAESRAA
jgi:hypothetical protein